MTPKALSDYIIKSSERRNRYIVAIAGSPGAGKSTIAQALLWHCHTNLTRKWLVLNSG